MKTMRRVRGELRGGRSWLLMLFVTLLGWSPAQETPYAPQGHGTQATPDGARLCGLVETNYGDPEWIVATSDRILRTQLCVATGGCEPSSWYDRVGSQPCYPDNRFWKLEAGATVASAFPLTAFGVGTFDGLYIKPGVTFQLFNGTSTSNPLTPEMQGPAFATPQHWVGLACNGFEPGTIFAPGSAGALGNTSLRIGAAVNLLEVTQLDDASAAEQRTALYTADKVRRRGSSFLLDVRTNKFFSQTCHEIPCIIKYTIPGGTSEIQIPYNDGSTPVMDEWASEFVSETPIGSDEKLIRVRITIPSSAPIGRGEFTVRVRQVGGTDIDDEEIFPDPVVVLFNPWAMADPVHMNSDTDRLAYVVAERGAIAVGEWATYSSLEWRFDQFDQHGRILNTTMDFVDTLQLAARQNPGMVAQQLAQFVNAGECPSPGGAGLLVGCWADTFPGGTDPRHWRGSLPIFNAYSSSGAVKYGQCWVFAGVLTSSLRTLGIPARPLSNFRSGTDSDSSGIIERYYNTMAQELPGTEGIWNFHVWCEAWVGGGWSAVDGTYQIGPTLVSAIHAATAATGGTVGFIRSEVNADVEYYVTASGTTTLSRTDTTDVGRFQLAQSTSPLSVVNVTSSYKASPDLGGSVMLGAISVDVSTPTSVSLGQPIDYAVTLTAPSGASAVLEIRSTTNARSYRGDATPFGEVHTSSATGINVPAGASVVHSISVPSASYLTLLRGSDSFETTIVLLDPSSGLATVVERRVSIQLPAPTIVNASPSAFLVRIPRDVVVTVENTTNEILTACVLDVAGSGDILVNGLSGISFALGTIPPGFIVSQTISVDAQDSGVQDLVATLSCDTFSGSSSSLGLVVVGNEGLTADRISMTWIPGVPLNLSLDVGAQNANYRYVIIGSATGTQPGEFLETFTVPLIFDGYTDYSAAHVNTPTFVNTLGFLDGSGRASASIVIPFVPGGLTQPLELWHAAIIVTPTGCFATNSVPVEITP